MVATAALAQAADEAVATPEPEEHGDPIDLRLPTPFLALDPRVLHARYRAFRRALPGVGVHYAVKCNPAPLVLRTLAAAGSRFEIASAPELTMVEAAGGRAADTLFSNPMKAPAHIAETWARGVRRFAADSVGEVRKLAEHAPGCSVYVRLTVDDRGSRVPLSGKFGTSVDHAVALLLLARDLGLDPHGVTFHVGSQCTDPSAWARAVERCGELMGRLARHGVRLHLLDLGGGFPVRYTEPVPDLAEIGRRTLAAIARLPYQPGEVVAEPGRSLVAEAGVLVATVIGVADRGDGRWAHLDTGAYHGLVEPAQSAGTWHFPLRTSRGDDATAATVPHTVTGPTCDSTDTMFRGALLPATLEVDDRVAVGMAGAYSVAYATSFNGFPPPTVVASPAA